MAFWSYDQAYWQFYRSKFPAVLSCRLLLNSLLLSRKRTRTPTTTPPPRLAIQNQHYATTLPTANPSSRPLSQTPPPPPPLSVYNPINSLGHRVQTPRAASFLYFSFLIPPCFSCRCMCPFPFFLAWPDPSVTSLPFTCTLKFSAVRIAGQLGVFQRP